jgi:LEA14-like dessication related protein
MFNLFHSNPSQKTQTGVSAFFCAYRYAKSSKFYSVVAIFLLLTLSSSTPATESNKPSVHLKGVSVKSVDWTNRKAETQLTIEIENPGPAFKVTDLNYRLKLNDHHAAEGKCDKEIELPEKSSASFEVPCSIDLSALPGVAWSVISDGFDVHYELETEFAVPVLSLIAPKFKTSIAGEFSLVNTVSGWTARIRERIAGK